MKWLMVNLVLTAITAGAYAQGQIQLANVENTSNDPSATANGLFWLSTAGTPALTVQEYATIELGSARWGTAIARIKPNQ